MYAIVKIRRSLCSPKFCSFVFVLSLSLYFCCFCDYIISFCDLLPVKHFTHNTYKHLFSNFQCIRSNQTFCLEVNMHVCVLLFAYICIVIRYLIIRGATIFVPGPILELDFQCDISDGVFYVQLFVVRLGCSCCWYLVELLTITV